MIVIRKIYNWCLENWKSLGIALGGLTAFLVGSKRQKDKNEDDVILLDQHRKEIEVIEKAQKKERKKIVKAEIKYQIAIKELEKKYDDETSKLTREKDHVYKQLLDRAKDNPDELDRILSDMGINEVKK
jgi:hypothetical protein